MEADVGVVIPTRQEASRSQQKPEEARKDFPTELLEGAQLCPQP
jgi:hypothetical protein